jgi:hypothetical protein
MHSPALISTYVSVSMYDGRLLADRHTRARAAKAARTTPELRERLVAPVRLALRKTRSTSEAYA